MLRSLIPAESELVKLCHTKQWHQASVRAMTNPAEAKPSSSAYRGMCTTALAIAVRSGAPLDTVQAIADADIDQLVKVRHTRHGTVLHDAIKHRASVAVVTYLIHTVIQYEHERKWFNRGELIPLRMEFNGIGDAPYASHHEKEEEASSSPSRKHTVNTLFNQTDDLGRTPLHLVIDRACRDITRPCWNDVLGAVCLLVEAFPPAVGKADIDGQSPLVLALMTPNETGDMEVEMRVFELVRMLLIHFPLAAATGANSAQAAKLLPRSPSHSSPCGSPTRSGGLISSSLGHTSVARRGIHHHGGVLVANRRMWMANADGNVGPNPLTHALMHGRSVSTIKILTEASSSADSPWHTGHLEWDGLGVGQQQAASSNTDCMAIVSADCEVPLHIAITMRASVDVVSHLLELGPDAAAVPDRFDLTPVCWVWIRFVLDLMAADFFNIQTQASQIYLPPVKASKRRYLHVSYDEVHLDASNMIWILTQHSTDEEQQKGNTSKFHQLIDIRWVWEKTAVLLPSAANAQALQSGDQLGSPRPWNVVHAAAYVTCPRALLLLAIHHYPDQIRKRDGLGNLPIHYASARSGYSKINVPVGVTQAPKTISELSAVFDVLPLFPQGARIANKEGQLPLHIAIEQEKGSSQDCRKTLGSSMRDGSYGYFVHSSDSDTAPDAVMPSVVMFIFSFYTSALERRDGVTCLYPFMQAAVGQNSTLDTVYMLLKENPSLAGVGI